MTMAPEPFFFTPPPAPRHIAELRIEPAHSAVAFSAPCAAAAGRKRRCLLPAASARKRMLLELPPFGPALTNPPPPPTPSPSSPPSPMASRAGSSPAAEFSFAAGLRPPQLTDKGCSGGGRGGNMFAFVENAPRTPRLSEASSAPSFLAALERPNTPVSTGPTARGGFAFAAAASPEKSLTPTGSNTNGGLTFPAPAPERPLTPTGSTASGVFFGSQLSPKPPARAGSDKGAFVFLPSPGPACAHIDSPSSAVAKETTLPLAGLATPPFVFSASRSPPLPSGGSKKRPRPHLHIDTTPRRRSQRQWEEEPRQQQQQLTPPPQKLAKTNSSVNGEASRSSILSGPCCAFFASPAKAAKQEAKKSSSEASRSPAGSRCTSSARPPSPEKPGKPEGEVEVSSAACSGAEVVVRVTCKCGLHREFCFDHRV